MDCIQNRIDIAPALGISCLTVLACRIDCNGNNGWVNSGAAYACCDGASTATCQDQRYADYTCSSGNCAFSSYTNSRTLRSGQASCNSPPSAYCSGSTRVYYDSTGSCSGSSCQYTQRTQNCPYGCSGGTCNNDPCSGVSCNSPPASYCSGSTRVTYNSPGTCSGGSCSYATSNYDCPTTGCSGDTRQTGGCSSGSCYLNNAQDCNSLNTCTNSGATYQTCNNGQACTAQNRVYNDYTCSGGGCALASSAASGNCPVVYSNCQSPKAAQATHIHGMTQAPVPRAAAAIHRTQKTVHTDAAAIPVVRTHAQLTLVQTCLRAHAVVARLMFTLHHVRLLGEHIPAPIQLRLNHASMVAFLCRALTSAAPTHRLHLAVFLCQALSRAM